MDPENLAVEPAIADDVQPDDVIAPSADTTEEGKESAPAAQEPSAKPDRDKIQERFDKLTREKYDALRARDALEWEVQKLREQQKPPEKAPTLAEFEYDEAKYQSAVRDFVATEARKVASETIKAEREQEAAARKAADFQSREAKFAAKMADYREVVYDDTVQISEAMAEVIRESEDGPALAYHLAKNREIAAQIARLPPIAAARELGKIEARLTHTPTQSPAASNAPPPPPKLAAVEPSVDKDPDSMSTSEWLKWREKQIKRKGNG